ncbi:hypothetical protein [Streptomyces marispadix]|uniref:Uncharacterized protein n=1 Tax=Streptomyces marispadix TaxID=2922868 RepID=A0ABS9SXN9_9ACTN|nr:hypothetical protein [Streptomyces marispadix]MCH6161045.1 hypothetical protein [Streptomyces marispadix]
MEKQTPAGGPVDFKFSRGWSARALVEIKLARSSRFWDGVLAQLPRYQVAEEVKRGIYVAIAYTDDELVPEFREKVKKAAAVASKASGANITSILIDARRKESASRARNPELSDELHERGGSEEDPGEDDSTAGDDID